MKKAKVLVTIWNKIEEYFLVYSLILMVALVFIQVIMRYIFNNSLSWSEELVRYIFIWQIWLGASLNQMMWQFPYKTYRIRQQHLLVSLQFQHPRRRVQWKRRAREKSGCR